MTEKYNDEQIGRMARIIAGIVNVYSPILLDDVADKIEELFPEDYKAMDEEDIFNIMFTMADAEIFMSDEEREEATIYDEDALEQLLEIDPLARIYYSDVEKKFADPEEILNYADLNDIKGSEAFTRLRNYVTGLDFKKAKDREQAFPELMVVLVHMFDDEKYAKDLARKVKGSFDRDYFMELVDEVVETLPRGFLHGYNFREIRDLDIAGRMDDMLKSDMIEKPARTRTYTGYSYEECLELADRLKQTDIFEKVCSDNLIELLINDQKVYIQLLGYYNGDRNIIVYGDQDNLNYNYQFVTGENGNFPDIATRASYSEVVLDDPEGFTTPDIDIYLLEKRLPDLPKLIDLDPAKGSVLSRNTDLIGAVLDALLEIDELAGDDLADLFKEGDIYRIVQLYLGEDGLYSGNYTYAQLGEVVLPFVMEPVGKPKLKAGRKCVIDIGIYTLPVSSEPGRSYVTLLHDASQDLMIGFDVRSEKDMPSLKKKIVAVLEENGICPKTINFNNHFAMAVLEELCDVYGCKGDPYGVELLDDMYMDMLMSGPDQFDDEELIH